MVLMSQLIPATTDPLMELVHTMRTFEIRFYKRGALVHRSIFQGTKLSQAKAQARMLLSCTDGKADQYAIEEC